MKKIKKIRLPVVGKKKLQNNYIHSRAYSSFPMINGQAVGDIAKMRYGLCSMSFNGCEAIAVYNALVYLKIPQSIYDVAAFMEKYRVFMGIFGGNVYMLGKALGHFGADYRKSSDIENAGAFIVSFWTKRPFLSSIHTVFCVRTKNGIKVYNRYNNCPAVQICRTAEEITGRRKPISVYIIER